MYTSKVVCFSQFILAFYLIHVADYLTTLHIHSTFRVKGHPSQVATHQRLASVPGLQTWKKSKAWYLLYVYCAHAPNIPDILPYNSINQCTDKCGVNIRCLRFAGLCMCKFQDIVVVWLLHSYRLCSNTVGC